jgi:hypothetical protein
LLVEFAVRDKLGMRTDHIPSSVTLRPASALCLAATVVKVRETARFSDAAGSNAAITPQPW